MKYQIVRYVYVMIGLVNCHACFASAYFDRHEKGWHWYHDPVIYHSQQQAQGISDSSSSKKQSFDEMKSEIKSAMENAIMNPSADNMEQYMLLQKRMSERASQFSTVWQRVLLRNPDLDFRLRYPTNGIGRKIYYQQEETKSRLAMEYFFRDHGLFFFYRSDCQYCHHFAPIIDNFARENGIALIPISMDGQFLPNFPQSRIDNGQSKTFNVKYWPALFAINPRSNRAIPIAYGLLSESELKDRIRQVAEEYRESI